MFYFLVVIILLDFFMNFLIYKKISKIKDLMVILEHNKKNIGILTTYIERVIDLIGK